MTNTRTGTTTHALLGLLALRPSWTASELATQVSRNMRFFWPRAQSRVYDEARRLVDRGFATAATEKRAGQGAPQQTRYRITRAGRRELDSWLAQPPKAAVLESEALLRVLLADLADESALDAAVERIEQDAEDLLATAAVIAEEYETGTAPFQDDVHVRALVYDYLVSQANEQRAWAGRARSHLTAIRAADPEDAASLGVAHVRKRRRALRLGKGPAR